MSVILSRTAVTAAATRARAPRRGLFFAAGVALRAGALFFGEAFLAGAFVARPVAAFFGAGLDAVRFGEDFGFAADFTAPREGADLLAVVFAAGRFAEVFAAGDFFAGDFFDTDFFAVVFFAALFFAGRAAGLLRAALPFALFVFAAGRAFAFAGFGLLTAVFLAAVFEPPFALPAEALPADFFVDFDAAFAEVFRDLVAIVTPFSAQRSKLLSRTSNRARLIVTFTTFYTTTTRPFFAYAMYNR
jgi:hypothetical protein